MKLYSSFGKKKFIFIWNAVYDPFKTQIYSTLIADRVSIVKKKAFKFSIVTFFLWDIIYYRFYTRYYLLPDKNENDVKLLVFLFINDLLQLFLDKLPNEWCCWTVLNQFQSSDRICVQCWWRLELQMKKCALRYAKNIWKYSCALRKEKNQISFYCLSDKEKTTSLLFIFYILYRIYCCFCYPVH